MARVYSSRIMLDPSVLQNMNNVAQQRYQNEVARRQSVLSPMRDLLNSAGKTFDDSMAQYNREQEVSKWDLPANDPIANAAREEYIRTGSSAPLQSWKSAMLLDAARKDAEQKQKEENQRTLYNTAEEWVGGIEDSKTKGGITSIGNISKKDIEIARNKIQAAKDAGVDTTLLEEKLDEILEIQTPESNADVETPNTRLSTEVQNKMKEDTLKDFKDRGAKLENALKTLDRKNKDSVDAYNAEIDALQAEIDAANMTNDVKLPSKVKQITKPSLSEANKGYKERKYTASQMDAFGYGKYYDDDTDSYHN